jgi:hypothetical protein
MTVRRSADQAAAIGSAQAKSRQNVAERATELTKSGRDSGGSQASGDSRNVDCHVRRHPSRRDRTLRRGPGDAPERDPAAHLKAPGAAVETGCGDPRPEADETTSSDPRSGDHDAARGHPALEPGLRVAIEMQAMLGASFQNILRRTRPFGVDEKLGFAFVE